VVEDGIEMKWIDRSIIESPYHVGLCRTKEQFHRELQRLKVPYGDWPDWLCGGRAAVHTFIKCKGRDLCAIVCINSDKKASDPLLIGLLVHEAVHVWQEICEELNEQNPSIEFEAYSIQTIAQRLIVAYSKMGSKKT